MLTDTCSWDRPGADRFTGDPVAAVARYPLPPPVIAELQRKMSARQYDDLIEIRRDTLSPGYSNLRDMHFGARGRVCATVTRDHWAPNAVQRALIYCAGGHCVALPTVCGNLSRITYAPPDENVDDSAGSAPGGTGITFAGTAAAVTREAWAYRGMDRGDGIRSDAFVGSGSSSDVGRWGGFGGGGSGVTVPGAILPGAWYAISTLPFFGAVSIIPEPPSGPLAALSVAAIAWVHRRQRGVTNWELITLLGLCVFVWLVVIALVSFLV